MKPPSDSAELLLIQPCGRYRTGTLKDGRQVLASICISFSIPPTWHVVCILFDAQGRVTTARMETLGEADAGTRAHACTILDQWEDELGMQPGPVRIQPFDLRQSHHMALLAAVSSEGIPEEELDADWWEAVEGMAQVWVGDDSVWIDKTTGIATET